MFGMRVQRDMESDYLSKSSPSKRNILLLIEVSDSTLEYDTQTYKAILTILEDRIQGANLVAN